MIQVELRDISVEDVDAYIRLYSDPRSNLFDDFELISEADADSIRERIRGGIAEGEEREFAILHQGTVIGFFTEAPSRGLRYLGYHILPEHYGRGFATASLLAYMRALPPDLLPTLRLAIDPGNVASAVVARKAGFVPFRRRLAHGKPEFVFRLASTAPKA